MLEKPDQSRIEEASDGETSEQRLNELSADPCLRSIIASNPFTPAGLIEQLARDKEYLVRKAVAGNPNAPWQILEDLAGEFPREFLHNPVGPLQIMAHPEQISTQEIFWGALLREASIPSLWWNWLKNHPVLSKSPMIYLHVQYVEDTTHLCDCSHNENEQILLTLAELFTAAYEQKIDCYPCQHQAISKQSASQYQKMIKKYLQRLAHSSNSEARQAVAAHPQTPEEVLQRFAKDADPLVRKAVAEQKLTSEAILCRLAQDKDPLVRKAAASHEQTPTETLHILARDKNEIVRLAVARRAHIPPEVIHILVQDTNALNRSIAISHSPIPVDLLCVLAQDTEVSVRCSVAEHPQTPSEILHLLSLDPNDHVRCSVAEHPQAPPEILERLCLDPHEWVRKTVASHSHVTDEILSTLAQDTELSVRYAVAKHSQTPEDILERLCVDPQERVRRAVASHPRTPESSLRILAQDTEMNVRMIVASNPKTPEEVLEQLCLDPHEWVRKAVAENQHAPEKALRTLANNVPQNTDIHHNLGLAVAMHAQASAETLHLLTLYPHVLVRWLARFVQKLLAVYGNEAREQVWWSELYRLFVNAHNSAWIGMFSIETQLEKIAALVLPEDVRQMVITALAVRWNSKHTFAHTDKRDRDKALAMHNRLTFYKHLLSPSLTPIALQKLAASPHWEVRFLMAIHEKTPWETRKILGQDGNRCVSGSFSDLSTTFERRKKEWSKVQNNFLP